MNISHDKEIINVLAAKHRVNPEKVQEIVNHSFKCIKECIAMDEMPNILIHNWGRFKPCKTTFDKKFRITYRFLLKDNTNYYKLDLEKINRYFKIYDRILIEENKKESKTVTDLKRLIEQILDEQEGSKQESKDICPEYNDTSDTQVSL